MKLGTQVGLGPGHIVLDGDPAPPPQRGTVPQFSAHVHCGQTAGWIKTALGMEVGLAPGHIVLDGNPAPLAPKKGASQCCVRWGRSSPPEMGYSPQFSVHVCCGQMAGWMKTPLGTEVDLSPGHIVLDGDPAPPRKGHSSPPLFSAHVYCGHGRPSQLLLSSCLDSVHVSVTLIHSSCQ